MATLSADAFRNLQLGDLEEFPAIGSDIIFKGAAVGENGTGFARPLVAGDPFLGFAEEQCDNSAGANGAKRVVVRPRGRIELAVSGASIASNDQVAVYASDDDTFTTTASTNTLIGYVSRHVAGTTCIVAFDAALAKSAA